MWRLGGTGAGDSLSANERGGARWEAPARSASLLVGAFRRCWLGQGEEEERVWGVFPGRGSAVRTRAANRPARSCRGQYCPGCNTEPDTILCERAAASSSFVWAEKVS